MYAGITCEEYSHSLQVYKEALLLLEFVILKFIPNNRLHSMASQLADAVHEQLANQAGDSTDVSTFPS